MSEPSEIAHVNHQQIVQYKQAVTISFWWLAKYLKESRDNKHWKFYADSFREYLASPEIGFSEGHVSKLILAFSVWHEEFQVPETETCMMSFNPTVMPIKP